MSTVEMETLAASEVAWIDSACRPLVREPSRNAHICR